MKTNIKVRDNKIIIGKKEYAIEKLLVKKLERAIKGVTQKNPKEDAVFIIEGKEGKGKTNTSLVVCAYFKARTNREVNLFFKLEPLMEFAKKTKEKIIIWDEPSLDSLSTDHARKINKDLIRLFMTARKKRHIFLLNLTKFWKFPEYLVVDRSVGLIKMREQKIGRFLYIRKKNLEFLWNEYKKRHIRAYKKASSFGGLMPNILERHFKELDFCVNEIPHASYNDYEDEKDKAILSIGKEEKKSKKEIMWEKKLRKFRKNVTKLVEKKIVTQLELARILHASPKDIRAWKHIEIEN